MNNSAAHTQGRDLCFQFVQNKQKKNCSRKRAPAARRARLHRLWKTREGRRQSGTHTDWQVISGYREQWRNTTAMNDSHHRWWQQKKKGALLQYFHGKSTQAFTFHIWAWKMPWKIERLCSLFDTSDALNTVKLLPLVPKIEQKKGFFKTHIHLHKSMRGSANYLSSGMSASSLMGGCGGQQPMQLLHLGRARVSARCLPLHFLPWQTRTNHRPRVH